MLASVALLALPYFATWGAGKGFFACYDATQYSRDGSDQSIHGYSLGISGNTPYKLPDCQNPKDEGQANLCQQRRSADSAAKQACLAEWQAAFLGWALIAAISGAFYAGRAARWTEESARAARDQATIAQRTMMASLGASVILRAPHYGVVHDALTKEPIVWKFWVEWENIGGTQTQDMVGKIIAEISDKELPFAHEFNDTTGDEIGQAVIAPKSTILSGTLSVRSIVIDEIAARKKFLYLFGWTEYSLIIPETPRYRVDFCLNVIFEGGSRTNEGGVTFTIHGPRQGQREIHQKAQ